MPEDDADPRWGADPDDLSPVQKQVVDLVEDDPGCTIRDVADAMDRTHQTAQYHLEILHRKGMIQRERDGRTVRHWRRATADARAALLRPFLEDDSKRRLLDYLAREDVERVSVNRIAEELDLYHGFVSRHLRKLEELDLVDLETRRNRYRLRTRDDLSEVVSKARGLRPDRGPG